MTNPRIVAKLLFSTSDLGSDDEGGDDQGDGDFDRVECVMELEPLGDNRYRVPNPTTPTPFGPYGTGFTMGQVIEAEPVQGEPPPAFFRVGSDRPPEVVLQYVATLEKPPVWTMSGVAEDQVMEARQVAEFLDDLMRQGCAWEWAVGNLSVQGPGERPSPEVQSILDDLTAAMARARAARRREAQGAYRWPQAMGTADAAAVVAAMHRHGWWPAPPDGATVANAAEVTAALAGARDDAQYMRGIYNLCRDHYGVTVRHSSAAALLEDLGAIGFLDDAWYSLSQDPGGP